MSTRRKLFRASALLGSRRVLSQILRLGRNVIIARLLSPEDFGIAATFWITTTFLDMISELGIQQRLIQAKDGDDDRVGAVAQSLFLIRGLINGTVLFALAHPIAVLFNAPETAWGFRLLALLPVMGGLRHRDVERLQRHLRFGPMIIMGLVPDVVGTIAAVPIALAVRDYSAFLYVAVLNGALALVASHIVAERGFRLAWDGRIVREFTHFGWPLMINSILMYAMMQGDRVILAGSYTKAELGVYSVAVGLVLSLGGAVLEPIGSVLLPFLSKKQDDRAALMRGYETAQSLICLVAVLLSILFCILGPHLIVAIYGRKYILAIGVVGWLGVSRAVRTLRGSLATLAMAVGDTKCMMLGNVVRQAGLGAAIIVAALRLPLPWIAVAGLAGEVAALLVTVPWALSRHGIRTAPTWMRLMQAGIGIGVVVALGHVIDPIGHLLLSITVSIAAAATGVTVAMLTSVELRIQVMEPLARRLPFGRRLAASR